MSSKYSKFGSRVLNLKIFMFDAFIDTGNGEFRWKRKIG